ncbi:ubiquitin carboxyl-terminal [Plasmopara halstedii]|uniref:Ubiquitin carboxyl-terminal hydrolase n=1 Tax=Plasmopara halstedii TaxID=4781 RepID=A0A0P1AAC7_PLAHL|nr:ubiquitin carboxyl-terminal [Plasmopara halstedii]CEG37377.1 ubiquitin carboxyl-terminal [Plasmopara halstedii]|eukprot:XP_024573746.1 ubiquitin carboxyl-terminal [Plasmopara halstedii]
MSWCTIESDPGVFNALIEEIGVKGVQVEELYTLDEQQFADLSPVYGLVFLFKYDSNHANDANNSAIASQEDGIFFAKQVISNACATQAILSILLNAEDVELGETLSEFKAFTSDFPPDLKGLAISNSDRIRLTHNSFARAEQFVVESRNATEDDDVYHFVAFVPVNGKVYELDGLKEGPVCLGEVPNPEFRDSWLKVACPVIQRRIERYSATEIRFNLLALVKNRIQIYEEQLQALIEAGGSEQEVAQIQIDLAAEQHKREKWAQENTRRKHNYTPLIIQLLKSLAMKKQLEPLIKQQLTNAQ